MGRSQREKGARGEREVGRMIADAGFTGSRMGRNGYSAEDVDHDIPGIHIEVKRAETLAIPKWLRQAERDAAPGAAPIVAFRQSRQPWRAVVPLDWLLHVLSVAHKQDGTVLPYPPVVPVQSGGSAR